ncbi:DNA repair protein RecN [Spirochaeta lutea]|uniref:DNA repair protein RecN n=1 Tax=Spirochaeta lutea TaxID=1480694 RepID=A0A098R028_9SPIO|nr:DNA repair protein RecN [Spirochaeta lutea]KGE73500.1 hypothetical protein DC28_02195 [Spirochaeta lutea]
MLEELYVKNFALIEEVHLTLQEGFTCFTGETGAGKSILAGALGLLSGSRGTVDQIRTGAEEAVVSGTFGVSDDPSILEWLENHGIPFDDSKTVIIRRLLRRSGKSMAYIQNIPTPVKDLTEFSSLLFDMHGQHEHQSLFDTAFHRRYLDNFGGHDHEVRSFAIKFSQLSSAKKRYDAMVDDAQEREREKELLAYAIEEIDAASLQPQEDEELEKERQRLGSAEELRSLTEQSYEALHESEIGILGILYRVKQNLQRIVGMDTDQQELSKRVAELYYELEDVGQAIGHYKDGILFDPARLEWVEERLDVLYRLKKKYGPELSDILAYRQQAEDNLAQLENFDENREALLDQIKTMEKDVLSLASELTKKRKTSAVDMEKEVSGILSELKMGKIRFAVQVSQRKSERGTPLCGLYGADEVEFLLSSNPGEPLKPIRSIASGGEISRVMLAIKSVLSQTDNIGTLIFDEIDTGIGGEVAVAIGEYFSKIGRFRQLLSITHLASIAVRADNHIMIQKVEHNDRTYTEANRITGDERVQEIARMLSGFAERDISLDHARRLLQQYHQKF